MQKYTAKGLSDIAGVSVRTLHYYDKIGLLKPAIRTEARYRLYGENELLKLQQILFFKELDFPLKEILDILIDPEFDLIKALESHAQALVLKQKRISEMLNTIEKTMLNLKGKKMITDDELYDGFTKEETNKNRKETIEKYGVEALEKSEAYLKKLTKEQLEALKNEQKEIFKALFEISNQEPESKTVQLEVARHYKNTRKFWGTDGSSNSQWRDYKGLGELYITDERFTKIDGKVQPDFAIFLSKAMTYFANSQLK
ncbi:DNA-binding transcriptional MerR regulator [Aquimarina sp. MAR_2010_214]|uniref:MerR family transcriptional regulator n=1 Tax=Aquimarina sp. MAR_2010_214 TaxID=1250026 RepID=UPI000C6FE6CA|nr:MerR family transcriptional regulator [Aquimarina sp. MAR_2010_214]PKV50285.1 DNA-binding transcriptional MerR regulator [Aquimarina sp. MAR_2010_214]